MMFISPMNIINANYDVVLNAYVKYTSYEYDYDVTMISWIHRLPGPVKIWTNGLTS